MKPQRDFAASLPHRRTARVRERIDLRRTPGLHRVSFVDPDPRIEREIEKRDD